MAFYSQKIGCSERLPNNVGFIPNQVLNTENLHFIISRTLACAHMPVYVNAYIKHANGGLEHVCAYVCMRTHALGFSWPFLPKNRLFSS